MLGIVNTKNATIHINGTPKTLNNTNELLGNLNGVDGVKTGFTNSAGRCLVTSTTRNGHQIICVVLGADTKKIRTSDSVKLIEYAFSNFEYINIEQEIQTEFMKWNEENSANIKIIKGNKNQIELILDEIKYKYIPINKNQVKDINVQVQVQDYIFAPINKNQEIGKIKVTLKDEVIVEINILAKENIDKKNTLSYLKQIITNYGKYLNKALSM